MAVADDTYTNGGDTMMMTWYAGGTGTDVQGSYCATADCSDGAIDTVDTDDFTAIADAVPGNYGMCKEVWSVKDVDLDTWNLICTKVEVQVSRLLTNVGADGASDTPNEDQDLEFRAYSISTGFLAGCTDLEDIVACSGSLSGDNKRNFDAQVVDFYDGFFAEDELYSGSTQTTLALAVASTLLALNF